MRLTHSVPLVVVLLLASLPSLVIGADTDGIFCSFDPSSSAVFVGTLIALTPTGDRSRSWNSATFRITEILQGQISDEITLPISVDLCRGSGTVLTVGGAYLIKTQFSSKGSVSGLGSCDQIRPADQAVDELEYLRSSQNGTTPTELLGDATVETGGYPWKRIPLPNTKIHLIGTKQQFDFTSDEDGRFQGTLIPGKFSVTTEFPTGYETKYCGSSVVTLNEHRCTRLAICGQPTGAITAHVSDMDGNELGPESSVQLTLETADDQQFVQSVWPDEKSDLHASNLLPGRYILGLNTYLPVSRSTPGYPPTYFPGVSRRSEAQVITLSSGEHKLLPEMRIRKGKECEIPVVVIDEAGKPSPLTAVGLAYSDYPNFYVEPNEETDERGREVIYAVFPGPVLLRAEKPQHDGSTAESEIVEVDSCPPEPVPLKLTHSVPSHPQP